MTDEQHRAAKDLFGEFLDIIATLRGPGGCPWDQKQTPASLRSHLIEEVYETIEAIDENDADHVREELGDVLLLIAMISQIFAESGAFNIREVISEISAKLVRRHPHVFGDAKVRDADEVLLHWERIKVDIEGDTAVVGDNNSPGSAHVFTRTDGTWTFEQTLIPSDLNAEVFGFGINLDGDTVLIGDQKADVDTVVDAGAAYVFTRTAGVWSEQQRLVSDDPQQEAYFGRGLDIEGDTAVVSSFCHDLGGMVDAGSATVFREIDGSWTQVGTFQASDPAAGAKFGVSAAMSGGTAVVGAHLSDHGGFTDAGTADVFDVLHIFSDGFEDETTDAWSTVVP